MPDINIGRLRGGLCAYWTGPDGKRQRYQLTARTRKEAETEALELYRQKTYASRPKDPTVSEIWDLYREDLGEKATGKTMGYTGKAILPHFGHHRPSDITKALCQAYDELRSNAGISQGSIHTELGHLKSALNFAADTRMIDRSPKVWRPAKPQTDKRILNAGEARALIEGAHEPHIRLALILLLGTAGRVGAVLDLKWDRVDFERGTINLRIEDSATRKGRAVVPMNGTTRAALATAHQAALSEYVIEYAQRKVGSIRKGVSGAITRSGIGHVRIHDLRHTAAVTMLASGIPIEKVSQVLGHSNIAVTYSTYARYLPEHMQDAVNVLDFMNLSAKN